MIIKKDRKRTTIERIHAAWQSVPDLRLGQFIENACGSSHQSALFYMPDDKLADLVEKYVNDYGGLR